MEKARNGYKTKLAAAKKAATDAAAQRVKDALKRQGRTAEEIAAAAIKDEQLKTSKARKRGRTVEAAARVSKQRLVWDRGDVHVGAACGGCLSCSAAWARRDN